MERGVNTSIGRPRPWIVSGLTQEQAESKYKGKRFRVQYEADRAVEVLVNSVTVRGGVTFAFVNVTKTLRRYKTGKKLVYAENQSLYAGRLEDIKIGGTI
jgi:hypothetical protein